MEKPVTFVTVIQTNEGKNHTKLLIDSLQTFGGSLKNCPFWLFVADPDLACDDLADKNIQIMTLDIPSSIRGYIFSEKVAACARAETLISEMGDKRGLVSIDSECLIVNPPDLFVLDNADAAVRPVHVRNVGLRITDDLDSYWQRIYTQVGTSDATMAVESFVDQQHLRAYFNSHSFAVNPQLGLMNRWCDLFGALIGDRNFQAESCADPFHQIFLFQALWSALLVSSLGPERIRILPPTYNYPYNLQDQIPTSRRSLKLNNLVCLTYEGRSINPNEMKDIQVGEPLRSWVLDWQD